MNYILGPCIGAIPPWESQFSSTPSTFLSRFFSFPGDGRKLVSNGSGFSYNVLIAACDSMRPNYTLRQSLNSESFGRGGNKFSCTHHAACHCQQRLQWADSERKWKKKSGNHIATVSLGLLTETAFRRLGIVMWRLCEARKGGGGGGNNIILPRHWQAAAPRGQSAARLWSITISLLPQPPLACSY